MKLYVLLLPVLMVATVPALAAPAEGSSTLRLNAADTRRLTVDEIDNEIAQLDIQISDSRAQVLTYQGMRNLNPSFAMNLKSQTDALEIQRMQLKDLRRELTQ